MNGFDILAIVLLVLAAKRGLRNGLAAEFYRLFRIVVALVAGTSLYRIFSDVVSRVLNIESGLSDPVLFIGATILAFFILSRLRRWMESIIRAKTPASVQSVGGAIAAVLKTGFYIFIIVTTVALSSWIPGHAWIVEESATGKIADTLFLNTEH